MLTSFESSGCSRRANVIAGTGGHAWHRSTSRRGIPVGNGRVLRRPGSWSRSPAEIVGHPAARVSPSNVRAGSRGSCGDLGTCAHRTPDATAPLRQSCRIEADLGSTGAATVLAGFTLGLAQRLGYGSGRHGAGHPVSAPRAPEVRCEWMPGISSRHTWIARGWGPGRSQFNSWLAIVLGAPLGVTVEVAVALVGVRPALINIRPTSGAVSAGGYTVGTGRVETCGLIRPAPATRFAAVQRLCASGERCSRGRDRHEQVALDQSA